jgi:site-specific recombinase XerD
MSKVKLTYVFDRDNIVKSPLDRGLIELRYYLNGVAKYHTTKITVLKAQWNKEKKIVKHPEAYVLNDELDALTEKINRARRDAEHKNQVFDLNSVKLCLKAQKIKTSVFTDFATNEVNNNNSIKEVTKRSYRNTINKLITYNNNKAVLFSDLNYTFFYGFINHLNGSNLEQSTIKKNNKNCKALIEIATKKGYFDKSNPCKDIKIKELATKINALTWEQITVIEKLNFEKHETRLEKMRDMFLFSCYTGLRVSDLISLKKEHLKETQGGLTIDLFTKKVNKHAVLPLYELFPVKQENTTRPLKILHKYLTDESETIFPKYSDQLYNRELKEIGHRAKIDFKLTSHIGRKTFATYLPTTGVSTFTLKSLLQHANLKTTERYVKTDEKRVNSDLKKSKWD